MAILLMAGILSAGCDLQELGEDPSQPRCAVSYDIVFSNTSDSTMYMGIEAYTSAEDLVPAGGSRTHTDGINLLMTAGHEEEHMVEMHVRSLGGQVYKYATYTILPKDWSLAVDPASNLASLSLKISCVFNGTDLAVSAVQL